MITARQADYPDAKGQLGDKGGRGAVPTGGVGAMAGGPAGVLSSHLPPALILVEDDLPHQTAPTCSAAGAWLRGAGAL